MFEDVPALEDLPEVGGARVLVRADLNVPLSRSLSGDLLVADDFRLRAALPTLRWLLSRGARVTVATHLGRPKGRRDPNLSTDPLRQALGNLGEDVEVMENVRFDPGEEANDPRSGAALVRGQDLFVNDAFGACHRAHASIVYPPSVLPSAAGRLLHAELDALAHVIEAPRRPFTVVVGGAKVADKLGTIRALARKADRIVVGGAMAFTFLAARGREVGGSTVDASEIGHCEALLGSLDPNVTIELPVDAVAGKVAGGHDPSSYGEVRAFGEEIAAGWRGLDIGPQTRSRFAQAIDGSATVLWNGPMGVFEDPRFSAGTRDVALAIAGCRGYTVAGGGDTLAAVRALDLVDSFDHLSTGGGAMLSLIEQGDLPGIAALREAGRRMRSQGAGRAAALHATRPLQARSR